MHLDAEGQDIGKPMSLLPVELVQNVDVSETVDDSPDGARVMTLEKSKGSASHEIEC
jgi:hypothetical protein